MCESTLRICLHCEINCYKSKIVCMVLSWVYFYKVFILENFMVLGDSGNGGVDAAVVTSLNHFCFSS